MKDLNWKEISKKTVLETKILDVEMVRREGKGDHIGDFVRIKSPAWIVVVPWFRRDDGVPCFIMEDQFRHGSGKVTREFPAGMVEKGEMAIAAAERELEEETGMKGRLSLLADINPNPALFDNRQSFFLAEELEKSGETHFDENEEIVLVEVAVEEAIRNMGTGLYDNGVMMAALGLFLREAERRRELREVRK